LFSLHCLPSAKWVRGVCLVSPQKKKNFSPFFFSFHPFFYSTNHPPPAIRDYHSIYVWKVFQDLQTNCSITGNNRRITYRMNKKSFHFFFIGILGNKFSCNQDLPPICKRDLNKFCA